MTARFTVIALLSTAYSASFAGQIEDQIRFRQSAYSFAAWNLAKIKNQVQHPDTFNKEQVGAAASAIAAIAGSDLNSLYGPGTEQGAGWQKTRVKPDYFQKPDEVKKLTEDFRKESLELVKLASGGDVAAVKTQFGKVSQTCKSCHDSFRLKDVEE